MPLLVTHDGSANAVHPHSLSSPTLNPPGYILHRGCFRSAWLALERSLKRCSVFSPLKASLERHLPKAKSSRSAHRSKHKDKAVIFPMFCSKSQTPFGVYMLPLSASLRNPHRAKRERRGGAHRLTIVHFSLSSSSGSDGEGEEGGVEE
ncbi:hypothetical protein AOLI_G00249240 [Acnodon oligacanthus]